ncbi:MAG: DEAD/DEAH box helicase family protein [Fusobacteriaceae bacterium]
MNLYDELKSRPYDLVKKQEIPNFIKDNLKYKFFEWQENAITNFLTYEKICEAQNKFGAKHLMFNMATGTGKTMLMASLILYFYKHGYRNFIFFVNQNNIVSKTESNFLDKYHSKYLFNNKIIIDDKEVKIKQVENFSNSKSDVIEIKFTTVQKLYNDIHKEKENQTTLEDLNSRDIIMLADEAHHLNSGTKKGNLKLIEPEKITEKTNSDDVENFGWEKTIVDYILKKNNSLVQNKNVLLEFTATIPEDISVQKKYEDKIIYKFPLKDFLQKGYTKEINLISSTFSKKEIILHALLLNWYRHFVALRNNIPNFKPVILFRSKTIDDSKNDYQEFLSIIENLSLKDFEFLKTIEKIASSNSVHEQGKARTESVLEAIKGDFSEVIRFIKESFSERNIIMTNSKTNTTKKEKIDDPAVENLLNSLEDKNNHIRAIFTVERLTEGWDVLNLYDIVRLYQGQNAGGGTKKTPEATVKEKQLIGRGVRYFPFAYRDREINKRKFDNDLENEMRVLEELFFYTFDEESRYISHLKIELRKDGFISEEEKVRKEFSLKEDFKKTGFYKTTSIIGNELKQNSKTRKMKLSDLKQNFFQEYKINPAGIIEDTKIFEDKKKEIHQEIGEKVGEFSVTIKEFENHIFMKALNIKINSEPELFGFEKLSKRLGIKSFDDLKKEEFFGDFKITIISAYYDFEKLSNKQKLDILIKFFTDLMTELEKGYSEEVGGDFKKYYTFEELFGETKFKVVSEKDKEKSRQLEEKLMREDWYVLDSFVGTSEERDAMEYISHTVKYFQEKYDKVFVLRNEEIFKIFDFEQGRGFQPDFLMFLQDGDVSGTRTYYQIFIEPKGEHLEKQDDWKEKFMLEITERYQNKKIYKHETEQYILIGLPFYTSSKTEKFKTEFEKLYKK